MQSATYFSPINCLKSMHEMKSCYCEIFWWKYGIICQVKISCDFPKLMLVLGCQLCFRPLCVTGRKLKTWKIWTAKVPLDLHLLCLKCGLY